MRVSLFVKPKKNKMARAKTHKTWTTDEETTLTVLVDRGITPLEIAKILDRTETSIIDKRQIQKDESQARYGKPWTSDEDSDLISGLNNETMQEKWQRGLKELSKRRFVLKKQIKQNQKTIADKKSHEEIKRIQAEKTILDVPDTWLNLTKKRAEMRAKLLVSYLQDKLSGEWSYELYQHRWCTKWRYQAYNKKSNVRIIEDISGTLFDRRTNALYKKIGFDITPVANPCYQVYFDNLKSYHYELGLSLYQTGLPDTIYLNNINAILNHPDFELKRT